MKITTLISALEEIAPPVYQEGYDNAGLIVGDPRAETRGAVLCLDATEAVIDEAIALGYGLVIAHHPIVFKGLKQLTGKNYVERTVIKAIKNDVAIFAAHTNLDHVESQGVNAKIAQKLGLNNTRILAPKQVWKKLLAQVPPGSKEAIQQALARFQDVKTEWINGQSFSIACHQPQQRLVQRAIEEAAQQPVFFEIIPLESPSETVGAGMIGTLPQAMGETDFLRFLKERMKAAVVRHTARRGKPVQTVAVCGGSGGFLLPLAIARGADAFVTADYKYHEFFDADGQILIADIGHFESEQFTIELFYEILSEKFPNFTLHCTKVNTNPVHYFV